MAFACSVPAQDRTCQCQSRLSQNAFSSNCLTHFLSFFTGSSHTTPALMNLSETSRSSYNLIHLVLQRGTSNSLFSAFMTQPSSFMNQHFPRRKDLVSSFFPLISWQPIQPCFPIEWQPRRILLTYCGQQKRRLSRELLLAVAQLSLLWPNRLFSGPTKYQTLP